MLWKYILAAITIASISSGAFTFFSLGAQHLSSYLMFRDRKDLWLSIFCFFTTIGLIISFTFSIHFFRFYLRG